MVHKLPNECRRGNKNMTFADCELTILRSAVDKIQNQTGKHLLHKSDVQKIIEIVERFLKKKKRICYGGTAINNILPEEKQFYDKSIELPDYDFFSPTPLKDAKELYIGSFVMDVQKPSTAARYALNRELYDLPEDYYETYLEKINAVTVEDVQDAAIKYFRGNKARIIITGKGIDILKNLKSTRKTLWIVMVKKKAKE